MTDLVKLLATWDEALMLLERREPLRDELTRQRPAVQRMRAEAERLWPAAQGAPAKPARGRASRPTIDRAAYRLCVLELLADNGGQMPTEDLRALAAERVAERGYCRKFLGKWFGELLGTDLVGSPEGIVTLAVGSRDAEPSPSDRAFLEAFDDVA